MFSRCFCQPSRKLLAVLLAVFSLLLSAVSEAIRRPSWKLFVVLPAVLEASRCFFLTAISEASRCFVGCLFAVVIGRLGSFSSAILVAFCCFCWLSWKLSLLFLPAVLEASRCFLTAASEASSCFRRPSWKLLAVLACHSCCFVIGRFLAALASRSCCFLAFFGRSSRCFSSLFFSF